MHKIQYCFQFYSLCVPLKFFARSFMGIKCVFSPHRPQFCNTIAVEKLTKRWMPFQKGGDPQKKWVRWHVEHPCWVCSVFRSGQEHFCFFFFLLSWKQVTLGGNICLSQTVETALRQEFRTTCDRYNLLFLLKLNSKLKGEEARLIRRQKLYLLVRAYECGGEKRNNMV